MSKVLTKRRQSSIAIITGVIVLVLLFWILVVPRSWLFKAYRHKTAIEAKLYSVEPPRGVHLENIYVVKLPDKDHLGAMGTYTGAPECETVIAHYKAEFSKQGFTYENQETGKDGITWNFSAQHYKASLRCLGRDLPQMYFVVVWEKA